MALDIAECFSNFYKYTPKTCTRKKSTKIEKESLVSGMPTNHREFNYLKQTSNKAFKT